MKIPKNLNKNMVYHEIIPGSNLWSRGLALEYIFPLVVGLAAILRCSVRVR